MGHEDETLGQVARISESSENLIRRYADAGLIECRRDGYGRRVFPIGTGELVRKIKAEKKRQPRFGRAA